MSTLRAEYVTDLTDAQWRLIEPLRPVPRWRRGGPGRPRRDPRRMLDGMLYLTKTGCPWALLPPTFGPWKTVYGYFNRWTRQGVWPHILDRLTRRERRRQGRQPTPSAGCVDSQTIKTATQGETTGYDAGKKIKGRKRHLWVDTLGLISCAHCRTSRIPNSAPCRGVRPLIPGGFSETGDGPQPGGLASAVSARHIRRLPATRVLQLSQSIPSCSQILSRSNPETVATGPFNTSRRGAGLYGEPSPVCRHTVPGDMTPPANPAKQWPGLNAGELAVGIESDEDDWAEVGD